MRGSVNYVWSTNEPLGQGATGAVYKCRHKVKSVEKVKSVPESLADMAHMYKIKLILRKL